MKYSICRHLVGAAGVVYVAVSSHARARVCVCVLICFPDDVKISWYPIFRVAQCYQSRNRSYGESRFVTDGKVITTLNISTSIILTFISKLLLVFASLCRTPL